MQLTLQLAPNLHSVGVTEARKGQRHCMMLHHLRHCAHTRRTHVHAGRTGSCERAEQSRQSVNEEAYILSSVLSQLLTLPSSSF